MANLVNAMLDEISSVPAMGFTRYIRQLYPMRQFQYHLVPSTQFKKCGNNHGGVLLLVKCKI